MTEVYYPPFTERNITLIIKLIGSNPEFLTNPECPYLETTKEFITKVMAGPEIVEVEKIIEAPAKDYEKLFTQVDKELSDDDTIVELSNLYRALQEYRLEALSSDKSSDKNTYFRVSLSLLEKVIVLKEKMSNLKHMNQFVGTVISIMEDTLDPDQRGIVMEKLRGYKEKLSKSVDSPE